MCATVSGIGAVVKVLTLIPVDEVQFSAKAAVFFRVSSSIGLPLCFVCVLISM